MCCEFGFHFYYEGSLYFQWLCWLRVKLEQNRNGIQQSQICSAVQYVTLSHMPLERVSLNEEHRTVIYS